METIAKNLRTVYEQIAEAAVRVHRDPEDITLVAVSKTKPLPMVQAAYEAGQRDFGENRLAELWSKCEDAQEAGLDEIQWHMIGTIQSRKTPDCVGPFAMIHSVDRMKIAQRISRDSVRVEAKMSVLIEVNVSGETSKHGFAPAELLGSADDLKSLPGIQICGLMTMAPYVQDAEEVRPVFRKLRELRDQLRDSYPEAGWNHLSMGMTNDFEVAIEEGATMVRVGTAIFGMREGN